jgi:hypothetical protein
MKVIAIVALLVVSLPGAYAQSRAIKRATSVKENSATQMPTPGLPIRRVVLYSNGVAYFERRGTVTGQAEINLPFKQSQVDDVLKSLVVLDLGKAGEQETRFEQIATERRAAAAERAQVQIELDGAIRGLALNRNL